MTETETSCVCSVGEPLCKPCQQVAINKMNASRKVDALLATEKRLQGSGEEMPSAPMDTATQVRTFQTGATRDGDTEKLDFEGFLSPLVLHRFGEYMHQHRRQMDGSLRDSDNWQKGVPLDAYVKSAFRHMLDWWLAHRGNQARESMEEALCALLFNVQGYLHETLKQKGYLQGRDKDPKAHQITTKWGPYDYKMERVTNESSGRFGHQAYTYKRRNLTTGGWEEITAAQYAESAAR